MANLHLVTGHQGKAHVTAADHGSMNAAIFGEGQYVLNRGSKLKATVISNNSIRIADGDLLMQGRHIRLNEGTYVDLAIENGAQGNKRNDLIVAQYTKDSSSGVEDCNLVVIKGTATTGTAADPSWTSDDILNDHVLKAEMPLYRVRLNGLNIEKVEQLYSMATIFADGSVTTKKLANGAVTAEKIATGAVSQSYKVTVPTTGWGARSGGYFQNISCKGLLDSDEPIVDISYASDAEQSRIELLNDAYSVVTGFYAFKDLLQVVVKEIPATEFDVKIKCVRK